jgi:hypothetical protein
MKNKILILSVGVLMLSVVNPAFAQFGKLKGMLPGGGDSAGASSSADLSSSKDSAVNAYLASTQELSMSLKKAGEAFGVKEEVLKKLAVVDALKEGNLTDKDLEKARQSSEEAQAIIKEKMMETTAPSVESKALMAESILHLVEGINKEKELIGEVQSLSSQAQSAVSSASPMEMMKLKGIAGTALTLVKAVPMDIKLSKDILSAYLTYAKANNIKAPKNASNLLEGE